MSNNLINSLKSDNQDFEFYPTTDEIILALIKNIDGTYDSRFSKSILDIGAGAGKVLRAVKNAFSHFELYAIEKANMLKQLLDENVYIIGTDFHEQSLLDKDMTITFCNPPYSEFKKWSEKIIRESCSSFVYLVMPTRWKDSPEINAALKFRDAKYETIGEYSFIDAEDRKARAIVNLVKIKLSSKKDDAFDRFFNEEFRKFKTKCEGTPEQIIDKEGKFSQLVTGDNYVKRLVEMYNIDMKKIRNNYTLVQQLDPQLLSEFDISIEKILTLLKSRLKGLKNLYWHELISRMNEITERLTEKKRRLLMDKLNENGHVDFTESNIYAVVLWILKEAGNYIDCQLMEVYEKFISEANCKNYKSNQKVFKYDRWRYEQEAPHHIYLEYRVVVSMYKALDYGWSGTNHPKISDCAGEFLRDLLTVANNLGFITNTQDNRLNHWAREGTWRAGASEEFCCYYKGKKIVLFEIKAHKNGNLHFRLNQKFALALNVEFGRLKGWIHSSKEASEELNDIKAGQYFKSNLSLLQSPFIAIEMKEENEIVKPVSIPIKVKSEQINFLNTMDFSVENTIVNLKSKLEIYNAK